jgi:hypothetical protein
MCSKPGLGHYRTELAPTELERRIMIQWLLQTGVKEGVLRVFRAGGVMLIKPLETALCHCSLVAK